MSLYLQDLPERTPEGYSLATHLQVLMNKGLKVYKIAQLPTWQVIIDSNCMEPRIICSETKEDPIVLEDQIGAKQFLSTTHCDAVRDITNEWNKLPKTIVNRTELDPPQHVKVINLRATAKSEITEKNLFGELFAEPCERLLVHDPYLFDREQIINRLGAYLTMAAQHNTLKEVIVHTKKASDGREQDIAEQALNEKYNGMIRFKHTADHDRFIEITRVNGKRARIIIGRGLDFIQPDGAIKSTYIVIQDPIL